MRQRLATDAVGHSRPMSLDEPATVAALDAARASSGFRDEAVFQHYLEGLRKAGWTG